MSSSTAVSAWNNGWGRPLARVRSHSRQPAQEGGGAQSPDPALEQPSDDGWFCPA